MGESAMTKEMAYRISPNRKAFQNGMSSGPPNTIVRMKEMTKTFKTK
jgi:hypothetical protein